MNKWRSRWPSHQRFIGAKIPFDIFNTLTESLLA